MEVLSLAISLAALALAAFAVELERKDDKHYAAGFDAVWNAIEDAEDRITALEPKPKKKKA